MLSNSLEVAGQVGSFTFMSMCDRASANLSILKYWGRFCETIVLPRVGPGILFWSESCGVHAHHRAKLQVKGLKTHTMRHFSIANLYPLKGVQQRMLEWIERHVPAMVTRVVRPAPDDTRHTLKGFVDVLFSFGAAHHRRAGKLGKSQRHQDLLQLCAMASGNLLDGAWVHYCHDVETGRLCCRNAEETGEKAVVATMNALLGQADPIPAESRWTYLLRNMKKTLLRRALFRVGLDCFDVPVPEGPAVPADVDEQAADGFMKGSPQKPGGEDGRVLQE